MYNEENGCRWENTGKSESHSYRRYNARIAARRCRQRQQRIMMLVGLLILIISAAIASLFIFKPKDNTNSPSTLDVISGTWVYDQYTKYEFDGYGKGCMCLENTHYEYSYQINGDVLSMDFKNEAVHDCSYTFKVEENRLTIVGGEGTSGGIYTLTKE